MLYLGKVEVVRSYKRVLRAVTWSVQQPAVVPEHRVARSPAMLIGARRAGGLLADMLSVFCGYYPMKSPTSPMSKLSVSPGQANFGQSR